ncbi:hypothetical protein HYALB_00010559 [Hymenoscyphus albidus]|uniref:Rad60/SUMO-like domain-containing protein n=1 Tax=Hymenoscyphus albidus TaxID=595503 RepID=A0A9N9Q6A5_9HELO|nr:hypothetical protein HYALB_00010559 [Hymenoscyphus albidus]
MPTKRKRSGSDVASTPTLNHIPEVEDHGGIHASFRDLMPNSPQTIAFLHGPRFSDAMNEAATAINTTGSFNVTPAQAVEELRRFLALKVFIHDDKAEKLSPTPLMIFMWQAAILDTLFHLDLQATLPFFIHYRPSEFSAAEAEARRVRLITMESLYHRFFGAKPLGATEQPRENAQGAGPNPEDNGNALNLEAPDEDAENDDHAVILDDSDDYEEKTDNSDNDSEIESVKNSSELSDEGSEDERASTPLAITISVWYIANPQHNFDLRIDYYGEFKKLFNTIVGRFSLPRNQFRVYFGPLHLNPLHTPGNVNMRDGDTVKVYHV